MTSFDEFLRAHRRESRAQFTAAIRHPHLVLWTELNDESDERPTAQFLTMRHPTRPEVEPAPADDSDRPLFVLPVVKREGSNAFTLMVTIGRAPNNDVVLADRRVSKFHAYFRRVGSAWTISDANSTNGTKVDEVPVPAERSITLRSGARVVLGGSVNLEFLEADDLFDRIDTTRAP
jgi:hypothetical protein